MPRAHGCAGAAGSSVGRGSGTSAAGPVSDRLSSRSRKHTKVARAMNDRIFLLLAATTVALVGCTSGAPTDRPRLLADEQARIGELNWLDARSVSLDRPAEMMTVELRLTSCSQTSDASATPRLVVGEPICIPRSLEKRRID